MKQLSLVLFSALIGLPTLAARPAFAAPPEGILNAFPLESAASGVKMKVRVHSPENGCSWGDLDAIQLELAESKNKRLLATLEPLAGGGKPVVTDISSFDLTKGFINSFTVPKPTKPTHYAFYICKDSGEKGKCGDKPAVPPQQVLSSYLTPMDAKTGKLGAAPAEKKEISDKIYYFGYILVNGEQGYALKNGMQAPDYDKLEAYFKEVGAPTDTLKLLKEKNDLMDSVQPTVVDGALSLGLPRLDKRACEKK